MSDYGRTMELVNSANNSAGSSQEQYEKTLDSMESKLNNLYDAWQQFTMGIFNSDVIKSGIDILTNILNIVNTVTSSFGDLGTIITRVGLIIGGLKIGQKVLPGLAEGASKFFAEMIHGRKIDEEQNEEKKAKNKKIDKDTIKQSTEKPMDDSVQLAGKKGAEAGRNFVTNAATAIMQNASQVQSAVDSAFNPSVGTPVNPNIAAETPATNQSFNGHLVEDDSKIEIGAEVEVKRKNLQKNLKDIQRELNDNRLIISGNVQSINYIDEDPYEAINSELEEKEAAQKRILDLELKEKQLLDEINDLPSPIDIEEQKIQNLNRQVQNYQQNWKMSPVQDESVGVKDEKPKFLEQTKAKVKDFFNPEDWDKLNKSMAITAGVSFTVATGLSAVANSLREGGYEQQAQGVETLSTGFSVLGTTMSVLPGVLKAVGVTAATAAKALGWIGLAIMAVTAVASIIASIEFAEEKLERLNNEAEESAAAFDKAKEAAEDFKNTVDSYKSIRNDLHDLTIGTSEWRDKVKQVNEEVLSLVEQFPFLLEYMERTASGELYIDDKGFEIQQEQLAAGIESAGYAKMAAGAIAVDYSTRYNAGQDPSDLDLKYGDAAELIGGYWESIISGDFDEAIEEKNQAGKTNKLEEILSEDGLNIENIKAADPELWDSYVEGFVAAVHDAKIMVQDGLNDLQIGLLQATEDSFGDEEFHDVAMENFVKDYSISEEDYNERFRIALTSGTELLGEDLEGLRDILGELGYSAENTAEGVWDSERALQELYVRTMLGKESVAEYANYLSKLQEFFNSNMKLPNTDGLTGQIIGEAYNNFFDGTASSNDFSILKQMATAYAKTEADEEEFFNLFKQSTSEFLEGLNEQEKIDNEIRSKAKQSIQKENGDYAYGNRVINQIDAISASQGQALINQYKRIDFAIGGDNGQLAINRVVSDFVQNSILEGIEDSDLRNQVLDAFTGADLTSISGIKDFRDHVEELGHSFDNNKFETFINKLERFGIVISNITFDKALGIAEGLEGAKESLEENGTVTKEQMNAMIEDAGFAVEDFYQTGTDEFRLMGDNVADALTQIGNAIVEAINTGSDNTIKKAQRGEDFETAVKDSNLTDVQKMSLLNGTAADDINLLSEFYGIDINATKLSQGYRPDTGIDFSYQISQLQDLYNKDQSAYSTTSGIANTDVSAYYLNNLKGKSLDELLANGPNTFDPTFIAEYDKRVIELAGSEEDLAGYMGIVKNELEEQGSEFKDNTTEIIRRAKQMRDSEKAEKNFKDALEDNLDILKQGQDAEGYANAINEIVIAMQEYLGEEIGADFVDKNLQNIIDYAEGVDGAWEKIWKSYGEKLRTQLNIGVGDFQNFSDSILNIVNVLESDAGIDFSVNADISNFNAGINAMIQNAGLGAKEIQALFDYLSKFGITMGIIKSPEIKNHVPLEDLTSYVKNGWKVVTVDGPSTGATIMKGGFEYGITDYQTPSSIKNPSTGGGGGGGSSPASAGEWDNPYDELYRLTQELNKELQIRNDLEREFGQLINGVHYEFDEESGTFQEQEITTAQELLTYLNEQEKSLERQANWYAKIRDENQKMIDEMQDKNGDYSDVISNFSLTFTEDGYVDLYTDETKTAIKTKENRLAALRAKEKANDNTYTEEDAKEAEKLVQELEDLESFVEKILDYISGREDAEADLDAAEDKYKELQEQSRDDYINLLNRVLDALVAQYQKEIDELSNINESINDTNSRILDGIQDQLDLQRQQRDNEKTENEIEERQRKLDYLRQDTSGANDLAIMQLEKEIEEQQEDYTDTLIDQKIAELQNQNDAAAEQRERQIELMQSQLDWQVENGKLWGEVNRLITEGFDAETGAIKQNSELVKLLQDIEGYKSLSAAEQGIWDETFKKDFTSALTYLFQKWDDNNNNDPTDDVIDNPEPGTEVDFYDTKNKKQRGTFDENGNINIQDPNDSKFTTQYSDFYEDATGALHAKTERTRFTADASNWEGSDEEGWSISHNGENLKDQWISYNGKDYYVDDTGKMATGWTQIGDKWYHFNDTAKGTADYGSATTGWMYDEKYGAWFYLDEEGANLGEMATGKIKIDGIEYEFDENGFWLGEGDPTNPNIQPEQPDGNQVKDGYKWDNSTGKWILYKNNNPASKGWHQPDNSGHWYYIDDDNGTMAVGWREIPDNSGEWYYLNNVARDGFPVGAMLKNDTFDINGTSWTFDSSGLWDGSSKNIEQPKEDNGQLYTGGFKTTYTASDGTKKNYRVRKDPNDSTLYESASELNSKDVYLTGNKSGSYYEIQFNGETRWAHKDLFKQLPAFKTGGLADFTGPAWLDGTKSRPELVLNQTDTQNFIQLKDVLASFMRGVERKPLETKNNSGDNYFDINIEVDEISSDYDVDQLADRIKQTIYNDAMYRNVNMISFHR